MINGTDDHTLEEQIRSFVAANLLYSPDGFAYANDASFLQEGIIDSLGVMHLVEFVQHDCHVAVAQHEVTPENFDSVARLAEFIRRKRQGNSANQ
jgi:acyl carrier protein